MTKLKMKMSALKTDPLSIEIPKRPANKSASEYRRAIKPIMEKRRRARINNSLNELKNLILDAIHKDPSRYSKLEKADILEITVRYLQSIQTKPQPLNGLTISKYRAGFGECAQQVTRYVERNEGIKQEMKQRLISYISNCMQSLDSNLLNNNTFNMSTMDLAKSLHKTEVKTLPSFDTPPKIITPLNLASNCTDLNNNCQNIEKELDTPPLSTNPAYFTFNFPPHLTYHHHSHLISPYIKFFSSPH